MIFYQTDTKQPFSCHTQIRDFPRLRLMRSTHVLTFHLIGNLFNLCPD